LQFAGQIARVCIPCGDLSRPKDYLKLAGGNEALQFSLVKETAIFFGFEEVFVGILMTATDEVF